MQVLTGPVSSSHGQVGICVRDAKPLLLLSALLSAAHMVSRQRRGICDYQTGKACVVMSNVQGGALSDHL